MRRFLVPVLAALGLAVPTLVVTAAPASALYTASISTLDTSVIGHVSGTVTTDAPHVLILIDPDNFGSGDSEWLAISEGSAAFDLETWGVASGKVEVWPCSAQDWYACEAAVLSESFTPQTVEPVVVLPEDVTIGDHQIYNVEVSSDAGGGQLVAHWQPVAEHHEDFPLEVGSNEISFYREGPGQLTIRRCGSASGTSPCVATAFSKQLTVQREFDWDWATSTYLSFNPTLDQPAAAIEPTRGDDFTLEYQITPAYQSLPVLLEGTIEHLMVGEDGKIRTEFDVSSLADGRYQVLGRISYEDSEFGHQVGYNLGNDWQFAIDTTAPVISFVEFYKGRDTVAPVHDGYMDLAIAKFKVTGGGAVVVDVIDSSGAVIDTMRPGGAPVMARWDGKTSDGELAPAGIYTLRATVTDGAGNTDVDESASVTVVRKKLAHRTFKKTVTAAGSFERQFVGACSQVARPSSHAWAGSLGIHSNTKCTRGDAASFVETHHTMKLPKAYRYGEVRPMIYGAAARGRAGSVAVLTWYKANGEWGESQRVGSCLRGCWGTQVSVRRVLHDDRWLYWAAVTGLGHRWDVKSFTITMDYYVLVNE